MIDKGNKSGVIALTTLILVSAMLLFGGLTLVLTSIDLIKVAEGNNAKLINQNRVTSCLEESLYRLRKNPGLSGQIVIPFADGNCTSDITVNANPDLRDLTVNGTYKEFTSTSNFQVDISQNPPVLIN